MQLQRRCTKGGRRLRTRCSGLAALLLLFSHSYSQPLRQHVVLVIIDGARYSETLGDTSGKYTPRMRQLAAAGAVVDTFLNDSLTYTQRAMPAIWSGTWRSPRDTLYNGSLTQYAAAPTMWEYFRKALRLDSTQALYVLEFLSNPWLQSFYPEYGQAYWPLYSLQGANDIGVWQNARAKIGTYHPALSVVYLADVDAGGHSGNWQTYTRAITRADSIVGLLWDFLQSDVVYRGMTTMFVTNDHGRHLDGVANGFAGHGDGCWGCRHVVFLGAGPGVRPQPHSTVRRAISDITPTIGAILQFPTPFSTGSVMTEILSRSLSISDRREASLELLLDQNYPNPFNDFTTIRFALPKSSHVTLEIYNLLGERVAILVDERREAGYYSESFDAARLSSGVYVSRLHASTLSVLTPMGSGQTSDLVQTKKMLLLK